MKDKLSIEKKCPLETARLLIYKFVPDDWKDYFEIEISREQHQYNHETYCPKTEAQVKEFIKEMSEQKYDDRKLPMLFAIKKKDEKK